jgi:hypothetical protein
VMATRATRSKATTPIAAVLLLVQVLAGGAVPLAHAGERETAPSAIEAHHDASCVVLHDAMRCALCLYASSRVVSQQVRRDAAVLTIVEHPGRCPRPTHARGPDHLSSPPRAPPVLPA